MAARRHMRAMLVAAVAALAVAILWLPGAARAEPGDIEITQFTVTPMPSPIAANPTQAGAHPNLRLLARFCGPEIFDPDERITTFCTPDQFPNGLPGGRLRDFTLHLPPGLLGNPTSVIPCPTALFLVAGCSVDSVVGYANTRATNSGMSPPVQVPTPLFRLETTGLEPARLGTANTNSTPPGPFPVLIGLRSTGDYGIDSSLEDTPWVLGQLAAKVIDIDTVLCGQAPCHLGSGGMVPNDPATAKPFAVNPTSCHLATTTLDVTSWEFPDKHITAPSNYDNLTTPGTPIYTPSFTPTGCENVPFDPNVTVTPDSTAAGQPSGYTVAIQYPDYKNSTIWQSALKDADVTLPEGVSLSPGAGVGLEECTADQFGVESYSPTLVANSNPVKCPEGSAIGTVTVDSPVLDQPLSGTAFFGPASAIGRPTPANPWKLFIVLEGSGLRVKLAGDVSVADSGQVRTTFLNQPEVPFTNFVLHTRGGDNAVLTNPTTCTAHSGNIVLNGYSGATKTITPTVTPTGCLSPQPFQPAIDEVTADPQQAGAFSKSRVTFSRPDGHAQIQRLALHLPAGATGSLNVVPLCPAAIVRALASDPSVNCSEDSKVGNIKTTVGSGNDLVTVPGSVYLGQAIHGGEAATFVIVVPSKVGPINLGRVIVVNGVRLRPEDSGVDVYSADIPTILEGIPLQLRKIQINVDRDDFFLNPTGCDARTFTATFASDTGLGASASASLSATGCDKLPFKPKLRLTAGAKGFTRPGSHPPLEAVVTQKAGEAAITKARVVVPDLIRPNVPQFNKPGALCAEAQLAARACPALSQVGTARVKTPLLPFSLSGPVYIVLQSGSPLPKLAVFLRGGGLEVLLNAKNGFEGIKILNTFENIPDVPQSYFQLKIKGGSNGILNSFFDLCKRKKRGSLPGVATTFTGQNGKVVSSKPKLQVKGCSTSKKKTKSKKKSKKR
jgi:hypothetical protein